LYSGYLVLLTLSGRSVFLSASELKVETKRSSSLGALEIKNEQFEVMALLNQLLGQREDLE
jgi:hypothetical protein